MPELPEVQTIVTQMNNSLTGKKITGVDVLYAKKLNVPKGRFISGIVGSKIKQVRRRAKHIIVDLSNGKSIMIHLKMTGQMLLVPKTEQSHRHTRVIFQLAGNKNLFFDNLRKFGYTWLMTKDQLDKHLEGHGPEPLERSFTENKFKELMGSKKTGKLKAVLLDQKFISGIGNIYADEICFDARINPERQVGKLSQSDLRQLYKSIKKILTKAVKLRGTSDQDYFDLYGKEGNYVPQLKVYGRKGLKCKRNDGGEIMKIKVAGRGTHYCPVCQKK